MNRFIVTLLLTLAASAVNAQSGVDNVEPGKTGAPKDYDAKADKPRDYDAEADKPSDYSATADKPRNNDEEMVEGVISEPGAKKKKKKRKVKPELY